MSNARRAIWVAICSGTLLVLPSAGGGATGSRALVPLTDHAPGVRVSLRYATTDNVFGERLYRGDVALLRRPVARRLARVQRWLARQGLGLLVWDAYRPLSVQRRMWQLKPAPGYVAPPGKGSKHCRGAAVDLTLVNLATGKLLPMPTTFDHFGPRAHRRATRGVSLAARRNARLLERAMRRAGFAPYKREWWHYTSPDWRRYPLADTPLPRRPETGR